MTSLGRLAGKVALITGASSGIGGTLIGFGGAAARLFAQEGCTVVLTDIKDGDGATTAKQITDLGGNAVYYHLDVTSEEDWISTLKATVDTYSKIDILVNNAGSSARYTIEETTSEAWQSQMDIHGKGVFLGTKHVIPYMRQNSGGSIINISSIYGMIGSPSSTAYHVAKGASRLFTKSAAIQYASENIRVNSIHPGFAFTPLTEVNYSKPDLQEWVLDRIPLGRMAEAIEIAYGILYLASDEASFVTGSELVIDGGTTAQ